MCDPPQKTTPTQWCSKPTMSTSFTTTRSTFLCWSPSTSIALIACSAKQGEQHQIKFYDRTSISHCNSHSVGTSTATQILAHNTSKAVHQSATHNKTEAKDFGSKLIVTTNEKHNYHSARIRCPCARCP